MALGIGACTAVFSTVDHVLFRSLPYPHAERLVSIGMTAPIAPQEFLLGYDYVDWRLTRGPFESFGSWSSAGECDLGDQNPVRVPCARADRALLPTLGARLAAGRNFSQAEDGPNGPTAVLISHRLWRSRFSADPHVIGKTALVDGRRAAIAGVLADAFELPSGAAVDILMPQAINAAEQQTRRTALLLECAARLRPGAGVPEAVAAIQPAFDRSMRFVPAQFRKDVSLRVRRLGDRQTGSDRHTSWILLGAVFSVLLIACANAANLLLARGAARQRERAVQAALGAGRARLFRQSVAESLLLSLAGCAGGAVLAFLLLAFFMSLAPEGIPQLRKAAIDLRAFAFSGGVAAVAGLAFGIAPALQHARLEATGARNFGPTTLLFRNLIVGLQVAVSVVLLTGAGLLLHSLWKLNHQPLGITAEGVAAVSFTLGRIPSPHRAAFFDELETRVAAIPGIGQIALTDSLPPGGNSADPMLYGAIDIEGRPRHTEGTGGPVVWRAVSPAYFSILRIPIIEGRAFSDSDRDPSQNAVILNQALARRMFPGERPLGRRIRPGRSGDWMTIVGVAANVKNGGLADPPGPEYYLVRKRRAENLPRSAAIVVRGPGDPAAIAGRVRQQIAALDATLPVKAGILRDRISAMAQRPRFHASLLAMFAAFGVVLAAIGLYGVVALLVVQRTREIGIRVALGATPRSIAGWVMLRAAVPAVFGAAAGVVGALACTRLLSSMLYQVSPADPWMIAGPAVLFIMIAGAASSIPALRAATIDPSCALRQE